MQRSANKTKAIKNHRFHNWPYEMCYPYFDLDGRINKLSNTYIFAHTSN